MVLPCFLNVMILIYPSALKISLHLKEDEDNLQLITEESASYIFSCLLLADCKLFIRFS